MADLRGHPDTDPTLDDDNQSDTDEEYEIIEEYEEVVEDESDEQCNSNRSTPKEVKITEVAEIGSKNKTLANKIPTNNTKTGRILTSQEESILLPLIQGLIAAGGGSSSENAESSAKRKNSIEHEKSVSRRSSGSKASQSDVLANNELNTKGKESSSERDDILTELSNALNRLQATLLDEKDAVTDTRKRNTILTLVAWLKKILQSPTGENAADTPIFSLTDLLPTELLLTKLMPQLSGTADNTSNADRSPASSKRFSRQRNKRFNTVGVSTEELADARLYLQKKLLSENLATDDFVSISNAAKNIDQQLLGDEDSNTRRKSLNISITNKLNAEVDKIIGDDNKKNTSKSIDIAPEDEHLFDTRFGSQQTYPQAFPNNRFGALRNSDSHRLNGYHNSNNNNNNKKLAQKTYCDFTGTNGITFDQNTRREADDTNETKPMNKFSLKKMKIKRANTIDIPKKEFEAAEIAQKYSKAAADTNFNRSINYHEVSDGLRRAVQANAVNEVDKTKVPPFEPKTNSDLKFMAFMNKQPNENRLSWISHNKALSPQLKTIGNNWTNKFDNIKNSFEKPTSQSVSPGAGRKNQFNHASTSPFIPVSSSKPPSCGPSPQQTFQNINVPQVHKPVPSVATNYYLNQQQNFEPKPKLQSQKSLPATNTIKDDESYLRNKSTVNNEVKPNTWSTKYASMDNTTFNNVVNKLRSPVVDASMPPPVNGNGIFSAQLPSSFNPLYIPLHGNSKEHNNQIASPADTPKQMPYLDPAASVAQSPYQTPSGSLQPSPNVGAGTDEFPKYTYTCTDYTRPACVSTYIPNEASPAKSPNIQNSLGPRTVNQSPQAPATKYNASLGRADYHSSSEYLSDTNSSRSPQPYYTPVEYVDNNYSPRNNQADTNRNSQECATAKAQVMKYPNSQTATVVRPRLHSTGDEAEEENAKKLHSFLRNNVQGRRPDPAVRKSLGQMPNPIEYMPPAEIPDQTVFNQNQSYIAPIPPFNPNRVNSNDYRNNYSNYAPLEYKPTVNMPQHVTPPVRGAPPMGAPLPAQAQYYAKTPPLRKVSGEKQFQAQTALPPQALAQQTNQTVTQFSAQPSVPTAVPLSPLVNPNAIYQDQLKSGIAEQMPRNNIQQTTNLQTRQPTGIPNLPKQSSQQNNRIYDSSIENSQKVPVASSRSKQTSAVKMNSCGSQYMPPKVEQDKNALWLNGCGPKPDKPKPTPAPRTQSLTQPKPKNPDQPPPHPIKYQTLPSHVLMNNVSSRQPAEIKRKQSLPLDGTDFNTFMGGDSDSEEPRHNYLPNGVLQRSKSGHTLAIMKHFEAKEKEKLATQSSFKSSPLPPPQQLHTPKIAEIPPTPIAEVPPNLSNPANQATQPNDELPQPGMVQHFIQSLNNVKNRPVDAAHQLQRSKSNHTLSLPKQYESVIKKSEVLEKERTVAAYFGGKSPGGGGGGGLQRSASQHNMIVRSQQTAARVTDRNSDNRIDFNSNNINVAKRSGEQLRSSASMTTTTTTSSTKSAHHLKILKKSQHSGSALTKSQTMPHISSVNLLDESNVDDAFEDLFKSFNQ